MRQTLLRECCERKKILIAHFTNEPSILFCNKCIKDKTLTFGATKIIQIPLKHKIYQIKTNNTTRYFCDDHNTSYPSLKSITEDHPNVTPSDLILVDKRTVGKSHTGILAENNS